MYYCMPMTRTRMSLLFKVSLLEKFFGCYLPCVIVTHDLSNGVMVHIIVYPMTFPPGPFPPSKYLANNYYFQLIVFIVASLPLLLIT